MNRVLMILEVSRKQDYIFASNKLRENAVRSQEIAWVTGDSFFQEKVPDLYQGEENMVYAGGGHTVLQFTAKETAKAFARKVTEAAMRDYPGMEIYVKTLEYDENKMPGENLEALAAALEQKKAQRKVSFRRASFGVEALDSVSFLPQRAEQSNGRPDPVEVLPPPEGWSYPSEFEKLAGEDNFIAVIHIDGNAMGSRVNKLYEEVGRDWNRCRERLQSFSAGIQSDFEMAFSRMAEKVAVAFGGTGGELPLRPVILAGDDVCFVSAGSIGLECAHIFMEELTHLTNRGDKQPYASCAGVALVHLKYPFHQAYDLAEELCSSAKRFGAELDWERRASCMDWHIEFGQLKDSLSELRLDYDTEDGRRLELRPVLVTAPREVDQSGTGGIRTYDYFKHLCLALKGEYGKIARGKIKELRTAMKQGEIESQFFLHDRQIHDLLYHSFEALHRSKQEMFAEYKTMLESGQTEIEKSVFQEIGDVSRCLYFDAIEMIDHFKPIGEVEL